MNFNNTAILLQQKGRKKLNDIKVRLWDAFMGKFFSFSLWAYAWPQAV